MILKAQMISETAKTTEIPGISTLPGDRDRSEPSMVDYNFVIVIIISIVVIIFIIVVIIAIQSLF